MAPPANQHRRMGLAPCPIIGFSSAQHTGPKSPGRFPQQTWLHACKCALCARTRRCLGVSYLLGL